MKKIMIELEDYEYSSIELISKKLNIDTNSLIKKYISSLVLLGQDEPIQSKGVFREFIEKMEIFNIAQSDIAQFLGISQASVSLALQKKSFSSVLGKELFEYGADKLLINIFIHSKRKIANEILDTGRKLFVEFTQDQQDQFDEIIEYTFKNNDEWVDATSIIFAHLYYQCKSYKNDLKLCIFSSFAIAKKIISEYKISILNSQNESFEEFHDTLKNALSSIDK